MRQHSRKFVFLALTIALALIVPITARAFIGTLPVIDWTAVVRIGRQIGISQETLNTLGLYVQQYNRINAGVQEGVRLARGRQLRGILNQVAGSQFPQFHQLQRDFNGVLVDPSTLRGDLELAYGATPSTDFPIGRKKRMDAADATATLGLLEASRAELVSQQEGVLARAWAWARRASRLPDRALSRRPLWTRQALLGQSAQLFAEQLEPSPFP